MAWESQVMKMTFLSIHWSIPQLAFHSMHNRMFSASEYKAEVALSFRPGRGRFTTAVELKEASQLTLSLLYHMAAQRRVKNPLEEDNIVGITNYLDMGLQVCCPLKFSNTLCVPCHS